MRRSRLLRAAVAGTGAGAAALAALGGRLRAQEPAPDGPPGTPAEGAGVPLLPPDALGAFRLGGSASRDGRLERVTLPDGPDGREGAALRVRTAGRPAQPYHFQLTARTAAPVESGDVLLATFAVRGPQSAAETGEARTTLIFEQAGEPYAKSLQLTVDAGGEWRRIAMPFRAGAGYGAGQAQLNFQLGFGEQVLELADVTLTRYGRSTPLERLPMTRFSYHGREPGAPWREAALARIEALRKGDLLVRVLDASGAPVPGATVAVRQRRHAFGFGSAVTAADLTATTADGERYREAVDTLFSKVVLENDLKWRNWEQPAQRDRTLRALQWLREHGLPVRGHTLVWPAWRHVAQDVEGLKADPDALRRRVRDHILEQAGALRGQVVEWDVVNEPFFNHDLMDVLGPQALAEWFALAREADPQARLFLNESTAPGDGERQDFLERTARGLLDAGAPLDGLGFQCHFGWSLSPPEALLRGLDRFAGLGLAIQLTELDVDVLDESLQADFLRDALIAGFSHPAVDAVVMWGFWEARHWRPDAALFRRDWTPKASGRVWRELVTGARWTEAEGPADARGEHRTRGCCGEYDIRVTHGARTAGAQATLVRGGTTVEVALA